MIQKPWKRLTRLTQKKKMSPTGHSSISSTLSARSLCSWLIIWPLLLYTSRGRLTNCCFSRAQPASSLTVFIFLFFGIFSFELWVSSWNAVFLYFNTSDFPLLLRKIDEKNLQPNRFSPLQIDYDSFYYT